MTDVLLVRYCPRPDHAERFERTLRVLEATPGVRVLVHDNTRHNRGLTWARNHLLRRAEASTVALMDFDVGWERLDFGEMAWAAVQRGVGAVTPVSEGFAARKGGEVPGEWQAVTTCACQCIVMDTARLRAMGGLDERYFVAYADWDLLNRLASGGLALRQHNRSRITEHLGLSGTLPGKQEMWARDRAAYRAVWGEVCWN